MAKKGVSTISGSTSPVVGEKKIYNIVSWYPGTAVSERNPAKVTWELYKKRKNGKFTSTNIKKVGSGDFTFGEAAAGHTYRLEAYRYNPEGGGLIITPKPAKIPKINKVELFYVDDTKGNTFSFMEKLRARAYCINMFGKELVFTLWEDDATGAGHNASNQAIDAKKARVNKDGIAVAEFTLTSALMRKAARGEMDSQLEFYGTVEYYTHKKHATENINVKNPYPPQQASNQKQTTPKAHGSPAASKPPSKKEEAGIMETISKGWGELVDYVETKGRAIMEQLPTFSKPTNVSANKVGNTKVEGLTDAYFAKKEYTKKTGEEAGTFEYIIASNGNKTATNAEKEYIAGRILEKSSVKALADKKEYTTKEAIKAALTKTGYNKNEKVTFKTFKLGAELKKITSARLEEKVYLVATSYFLEGKNATITVKEKDGLIKGSANAAIPLCEISEAKMASTEALTEADRTEKTTFSGTISKVETGKDADGKAVTSEMYIVPVQLRPKTDADLAAWKEKIAKGDPDGEYTYTFKNGYGVIDSNKGELAAAIINNAKKGSHGNPKLDAGKMVHAEDVRNVLQTKTYAGGETIKFPVYKKVTEMLWLEVTASGTKQHKKEFLKGEGAYFEIGAKCFCNRDITVAEFEDILEKIRQSERNSNTTDLFYADNCNLDDKTVASFVSQLNTTLAKFDVNTCIRKIHFLAQVYHETDRFRTTKEYASGNGYNPGQHAQARANGNNVVGDGPLYKGKGLMQLTWKNNYKYYKSYSGEDVVASPNRVADELILALDSAGWYWKQGKVLSAGTKWNVPNTTYSRFDNSTGKEYPKTTYDFPIDGGKVSFGAVDLNLLADDDYIDTISWLVNGGGNGRMERRRYLAEIKRIFMYPAECINAGNTAALSGSKTVNIHFEGSTADENGISQLTRTILEEVGEASSNPDITITSTARTPAEQARIMYGNIERTGAAEQLRIYANAGDQVINTYTAGKNAGKSKAQIISDMEAKMNELGPSTVSKHLADPTVMNTFDVSIRRLANPNDFRAHMLRRSELHQLLDENGAYHIEINQ